MASVVFFSHSAITPILGQIEARLIIHADDTTCRHLLIMNADYRLPAFHTFEELPAIGETRRIRHRKHIFHLFRGMATSSAPGEDFSDPLDRPSLVERLENDVHDLKDISSSLEKAGRVTPEHLKGLDEAFQTVEREDFPDLEFCVKNTSEIQCKNNGGVDPTGDLAKLTLEKMDAALTGVPWTAHDILLPLKGSLKRTAPGEGEARAAQLQNFIEEKSIPAIEGVKEAYRHLSTVTREAYWAGLSSDSEGEVSGPVPGGESSSGGGENLRSGPTETEDPSGSGEDPGSGPTGAGGSGAGPVPSVFEDDGWIERAIESIKSFL